MDYTLQIVAGGTALLGMLSGVLGSFAVLRGQSLLGDSVSHAALPGVVLSFLVTGSKHTEVLLLGALLSGLFSVVCVSAIVRHTRIKFDTALALTMSVFFGLGMALLTQVQKIPNAHQAGLKRFLFGQASALLPRDLTLTAVCGVAVLAAVLLLWKELQLFTFDADFAKSLGFSPRLLEPLLSLLLVLTIILGLQTVGVILMSALLTAPAVAARQWTNRLQLMVWLAAGFGALAGVCGTAASALVPRLPTGPAIVCCVSIFVLVSMLFAPERGLLRRLYRRAKLRAKGGLHDAH